MTCDVDITALVQPEKRPGSGVKNGSGRRVTDRRGKSCMGFSFPSAMDASGNNLPLPCPTWSWDLRKHDHVLEMSI